MRVCISLAITGVILAVGVANAFGSTVGRNNPDGTVLEFTGALGETNDVTITLASGVYTVTDSNPITPGNNCNASGDPKVVTCPATSGSNTILVIGAELGDGNDSLTLDAPTASILLGDTGNDTISGGSSTDLIYGGSGNDTLLGNDGPADVLSGETGNDTLDGGGGDDKIVGGADTDTADYSDRSNAVTVFLDTKANDGEAGEGDEVRDDVEKVIGGSGDDVLLGGLSLTAGDTLNNTFYGGPGQDILIGLAGNDVLSGDDGNDFVFDEFYGGSGNDILLGGNGDDIVNGGKGIDILDGGAGADALAGGADFDYAWYATRSTDLDISLDGVANDGEAGEGDDVQSTVEGVLTGSGDDVLTGNGDFNFLAGSAGTDTIDGRGGNDSLGGGAGNDTVNGGDGNDAVVGGPGDDTLVGGAGTDDLRGNVGNDIIDAQDDVTDTSIACGDGTDQALVDSLPLDPDSIISGCETVTRGAVPEATVGRNIPGGPVLEYGGTSVADDVTITLSGGVYTVSDTSNRIKPGNNCEATPDPKVVTCAALVGTITISAMSIATGAGNDTVTLNAPTFSTVNGGPGDDTLNGGDGYDTLDGGFGDDTLVGGAGTDDLRGNVGNDTIDARDGISDNRVACGDGTDQALVDSLPLDPDSIISGCETVTRS